jgi:hypothetical protein
MEDADAKPDRANPTRPVAANRRTTADVLLVVLPQWTFKREPDPASGYAELVVERKRRLRRVCASVTAAAA